MTTSQKQITFLSEEEQESQTSPKSVSQNEKRKKRAINFFVQRVYGERLLPFK